jgi:hypothetical protein
MDENLLTVRASLGFWQSPDNFWTQVKEKPLNPFDPYPFEIVKGPVRSYDKPIKYGLTLDATEHFIHALYKDGWTLTRPTHPELQQFFRNGKPITGGTIMEDFLSKPRETKTMTAVEAMLAAFK